MNSGIKNTASKYQTNDIVEHHAQKSSGEKVSVSYMEQYKKWIAMLPVVIRG